MFGKGLAFDSITGDFRLFDGNATTDNLAIVGSSANISITGRTGLRARDYDQQVYVAGALTMPAKPAAIAPMPNTIMNTRWTLMPSAPTITESSMPARTVMPSRVHEHQEQREQRDRDDADQRQPVGWIVHEAE